MEMEKFVYETVELQNFEYGDFAAGITYIDNGGEHNSPPNDGDGSL